MSTLGDVLQKQKNSSVLEAPKKSTRPAPLITQTNSTLNIALRNETRSNNVYAYITGLAVNNSSSVFLLQADGITPYYPASPSSDGSQLAFNCAIPLGAPGNTRIVTIPQLVGARVWFSVDSTLTFLLNPGPGLVEPSVTNPSDPNINNYWDFCELSFNSFQVFANISYVDFVSLPIALTLTNTSGGVQHVAGLPSNGLDTICDGLRAQDANDHAGWSNLVVTSNGANVRALSPNNGIVMNNSLFSGYYEPYVDEVWSKYRNSTLTINTQASWGDVNGEVSNDALIFSGTGSWNKPSTADIFNCSSGAFSNTIDEVGNIGARLAAAFNRSTLLLDSDQPNSETLSSYYQASPTNHYSRIVHATNLDGLGYAFPYDDVHPSWGGDVAGTVADGSPQLLTVTVGGNDAHAKTRRRRGLEVGDVPAQLPVSLQKHVTWKGGDEKKPWLADASVRSGDLEKRADGLVRNEATLGSSVTLPAPLQRFLGRVSAKLPTIAPDSPFGRLIAFLHSLVVSTLSLSVHKLLSRVLLFFIMIAVYLVAGRMPRGAGADMRYGGQMAGVVGAGAVNLDVGR